MSKAMTPAEWRELAGRLRDKSAMLHRVGGPFNETADIFDDAATALDAAADRVEELETMLALSGERVPQVETGTCTGDPRKEPR